MPLAIHTALDLLEPEECDSLLFTGHVGCGKTSELNRIADHWQSGKRR